MSQVQDQSKAIGGGVLLAFFYFLIIALIYSSIVRGNKPGGYMKGGKKGSLFLLLGNILAVLYFVILCNLITIQLLSKGIYGDQGDNEDERFNLNFWTWFVTNLLLSMYMIFHYYRMSSTGKIKGWGVWYIIELIIILVVLITLLSVKYSN